MYVASIPTDSSTLYQGDIIRDFPFYIFDKEQSVVKTENGYTHADTQNEEDRSLFVVEARRQRIMLLSQSCDIQRRSNIVICPVYAMEKIVSEQAIKTETLKSIRARRIKYWFYLPAFNDFPESIADFQTMTYVPRETVSAYLNKRDVILNDLGRHHLAWSLATYFGRPAEP